jgi:ketosteroid isomerase-like protein
MFNLLIDVAITLFSLSGQRLDIPLVTLGPHGESVFNLADWALAVPFQKGSVQVRYFGAERVVAGSVNVKHEERSLIFEWLVVYHGEVPILDPKNPPKAAPAAPAKKEEPKKDDKAAANSNTTVTKPAADPSTNAMMAIEKSVWEAWKARDTKKLEDLTTKDLSFVNVFGTYFANKADTLKDWAGNCDIKSVKLTDSAGTTLSPTVGILTSKGTAEGSCYGQKLAPVPVYATSVYVKDGDAWKLAFGLNRLVN